jgi:hypothetical protein
MQQAINQGVLSYEEARNMDGIIFKKKQNSFQKDWFII